MSRYPKKDDLCGPLMRALASDHRGPGFDPPVEIEFYFISSMVWVLVCKMVAQLTYRSEHMAVYSVWYNRQLLVLKKKKSSRKLIPYCMIQPRT